MGSKWIEVGEKWVLLGFDGSFGCHYVLLGFTELYNGSIGFLPDLIKFQSVLLGFTGFYTFLLGFTELCNGSIGFTCFYWVLLGFNGF